MAYQNFQPYIPQYNQYNPGGMTPQEYYNTLRGVPGSPATPQESFNSRHPYYHQDSASRTVGSETMLQTPVEEEKQEELPQKAVDYSLYDFPDPEILPPDRPPPKIIVLEKDNAEVLNLRLEESLKRLQDKPKPIVASAHAVVVDTIDCCRCAKKKSSSEIKCEKHFLCVDCCAEQYLAGDLFCPEASCKQNWTMMQVLKAHFVVCGESLPQYFQRRPAEPKIPMDGCICIGDNRFIRERLEEDKAIEFPRKGHLTYNNNRAMEACPQGHVLCKPCAIRIVENENGTCPECKTKLNFEPPAPACPEPAPAAAAKK